VNNEGTRSAGERFRFPALDPEPPPRSWQYRAGVVTAALAVACVLSAVGLITVGSSHASSSSERVPAVARVGNVLALTGAGGLLETAPDGTGVRPLASLGQFPLQGIPDSSADSGLLTFSDGEIVSTAAGGLPSVLFTKVVLRSDQVVPVPAALADDDRDVVVLTEGTAGVAVASLATGTETNLGTGDAAAGDPQQSGAFVSVAAPPQASNTLLPAPPDAQLELRDAGKAPVVLATAAELNHDLGQQTGTPVQLIAMPDPSGDLVAVEVDDLSGSPSAPAAMVLLNRSGQVTATFAADLGPASYSTVGWSPDGTALAYLSISSLGPALTISTLAGGSSTRQLPGQGVALGCLWAPTGAAVLCDTVRSGTFVHTWNVADAGGGPIVAFPGPGLPLDWFDEPGTAAGRK